MALQGVACAFAIALASCAGPVDPETAQSSSSVTAARSGPGKCSAPVEALSPVTISRFPGASSGLPIDPERELTIRDLSVVEDSRVNYPGPWSFGYLMEQMSGPHNASEMTQVWLFHWMQDQTINSFNVPARTRICTEVINPWFERSGCRPIDCSGRRPPEPDRECRLNFERAPFRLLEIVNRIDLMRTGRGGYGGSGDAFCGGRDPRPPTESAVASAGEGRFVWGVLDREYRELPFTVIFEYEQSARSGCELQELARVWHQLSSVPFGGTYNKMLEELTHRFTDAGRGPGRPNESLLNQLRTNETALARPWELREFRLSCDDGFLRETTVNQTPDSSYDQTNVLANFLDLNAGATVIQVPLTFAGTPFLGGNALVTNGFWQRPAGNFGINDDTHNFSVNTCDGCHSRETDTKFTHTDPRPAGVRSNFSMFTTGDPSQPDGYFRVSDPRDPACRTWLYNEWQRRSDDLAGFLRVDCGGELEEIARREAEVTEEALRRAEGMARGTEGPAPRGDERVRVNTLRAH